MIKAENWKMRLIVREKKQETKVKHLTKVSYPGEYAQQNKDHLVEIALNCKMKGIFNDETDLVNNDDADIGEDEAHTEFALWLRSISQCLSGKISKEPVRPAI